jgi:hypothetical protein
MEISYVLNVEDLVALQRAHLNRHLHRSRIVRLFVAFLVLLMVVPSWVDLFGELRRGDEDVHPIPAVILTFLLAFVLGFGPIISRWRSSQTRRFLSKSDQRRLFCPQRLVLSPDAVQMSSEFTNATNRWSGISRVEETASHIFIFLTSNTAHIIPRRAFASESAYRQFAETARQYKKAAEEKAHPSAHAGGGDSMPRWPGESAGQFRSADERQEFRPAEKPRTNESE